MDIGAVIRTNRKKLGLTQEQMASRLGVTAPAVNKWERGAALPDIALLGPIARLLGVSLEELLSFREDLTEEELADLIGQGDRLFSDGPYEEAFAWVRDTLAQWPNCGKLTMHLVQMLDSWARLEELPPDRERDRFITDRYIRLLESDDEDLRRSAAEALVSLHLWWKQYEGAEAFLKHFSKYDPLGKLLRGRVQDESGRTEEALRTYEELLFQGCSCLTMVLQEMQASALRSGDRERARMLAEKQGAVAAAFDMGKYAELSPLLEPTLAEGDADGLLALLEALLERADTLGAFAGSPLYAHMTFKPRDPSMAGMARRAVLDVGEEAAVLRDDPRWAALRARWEEKDAG